MTCILSAIALIAAVAGAVVWMANTMINLQGRAK
jgi:hypothetical protein